jgi:hypothetical protein
VITPPQQPPYFEAEKGVFSHFRKCENDVLSGRGPEAICQPDGGGLGARPRRPLAKSTGSRAGAPSAASQAV